MNAIDIMIVIILVFAVVQSIDYAHDHEIGQDYLDEKDEALNSFLYRNSLKNKQKSK